MGKTKQLSVEFSERLIENTDTDHDYTAVEFRYSHN